MIVQETDHETRLKRLRFRAWHRGTREADYMVGGFFDKYHVEWDEAALRWFEALIDEQDVDIIAWAFNQADPPASYDGPMLTALRVHDYIDIPR